MKGNNRRHFRYPRTSSRRKASPGLKQQREQMFLRKTWWDLELSNTALLARDVVLEAATARRAIPEPRSSRGTPPPALFLPFCLLSVLHWADPTRNQRTWSPTLPWHPSVLGWPWYRETKWSAVHGRSWNLRVTETMNLLLTLRAWDACSPPDCASPVGSWKYELGVQGYKMHLKVKVWK